MSDHQGHGQAFDKVCRKQRARIPEVAKKDSGFSQDDRASNER